MGIHRALAVLMAIVMILAPIAGAAGTVAATASPTEKQTIDDSKVTLQTASSSNPSNLPGNFINATESVDVWDRAIFPLRADRSDDATTATSVDNIFTEAAAPNTGASPLQTPDNRKLVVYPNDATIDLSFNVASKTDAQASDLDGEEIHLIAAKAESSDDPELPSAISIQTLRNFVQNESDNENVLFENASTKTVGTDGSVSFSYDLTSETRGAGTYTFMAVTTAGDGIEVVDNNISVPGHATVLGVDGAIVQQTSSQVSVDDTHEVGDTISFDVDANVATSEGRVEHTVALWNESAVAEERLTIVAPDTITENTAASEFTIDHTIENVAGVQNVEDDVSAFGRTLSQNNRSGVFELADIVSFIANEGNFSEPQTNRVGTTTINASMTSVNASSADTTVDVETLESFETGEYVAVHLAMADGNLTKVSSERTTITLTEPGQLGFFNVSVVSTNEPVSPGDTLEVTTLIENTGGSSATQQVALSNATGDTVDTANVTLAAGESTTQTLEYTTTENDTGANQSFTVASDDTETSVNVTIGGPQFDITNLETTGVGDAGDNFTANVTVENTGIQTGTQNVSISYAGEVVFDEARELAVDETNTTSISIDTEAADAGEQTVIAETDDDRAIETVDLSAPPFFAVDVNEFDSDTQVVAGQNATIVAEVTNTGETQTTQDISITSPNTDITVSDIVLNGGETREIERDVETVSADGNSTIDVTVASDDDSDSLPVTVDNATGATYTVDILAINETVDEPAASGDETVEAEVQVENIGQQNGNQEIVFAVDGDERETNGSVELDASAATTFNQTIELEPGDAPAVDVSVSSANDTDTESVTVTPLPEFVITSVDVPGNVEVDEEFTPNVTVENVGGQSTDATVGIFFDGSSVDTSSATNIGPGGTANFDSIPLNATEQGVGDGVTAQVEANVTNAATSEVDDFDTSRVLVSNQAPPNLTVQSLDVTPASEVVAGEGIDVNATINNTGQATGNQTVVLEFGGTEFAAEDVTLAGSETTSIEDTFNTRSVDIGDGIEVAASTDNDENTSSIDVLQPATFEAEIINIDDEIIAGDSIGVDVRVRNTGEEDGESAELRVISNGDETNRSVQVDGGSSTVESFDLETNESDVGELDVAAATTESLDTRTVTAGSPGELEVEFASFPAEITENESFNTTVRVENVGDGEATETITLLADGFSDSATVTLDGGEAQNVELSDANVPNAPTSVNVQAVSVSDSTEQRTVSIVETPEQAEFALSTVEAPATVLEPESSTNITVNTTVTNIGDQNGAQQIDLTVDGEQVNSTDVVLNGSDAPGGSESQEVSLSFTLNAADLSFEDGTDELGLELSSENRTVTGTLAVEEAQPATLEIVDLADLESVSAGDTLSANVTIQNVGDRDADSGTVSLSAPNIGGVAPGEVTVQPNASEQIEVEVGIDIPDEPRAGEFDREFRVTAEADGQEAATAEETFTETVDYGSIRSGVAQAASGDTVRIASDERFTERDTIVVDTPNVALEAAGSGRPTIAPTNGRTAISVEADGATLRGLSIEGDGSETGVITESSTTVESVDISGWDTGIESTSGELTLRNARIENVGTGAALAAPEEAVVAYSTIRPDNTGILATAEDATVRDSSVVGAQTGVDVVEASDVSVERTTLRGNDIGYRALDVGDDATSPTVPIGLSNLEANELAVLADNSTVNANNNYWGVPGTVPPGATLARSTVTANDPRDSRTQSQFEVTLQDSTTLTNGSFERGVSSTVPVEIENTGTKGDTQEISVSVTGGPDPSTQDVTIDPGATETVEFTFDVDQRFSDSITLAASSLDDSESESYDVIESDSIDLSLGDSTITTAETTTASVNVVYSDGFSTGTNSATITSNDSSVATVSGTTVNPQSAGDATIEATFTSPTGATLTDTANITVTAAEEDEQDQEDDQDDADDDTPPSGGGGGGGGGGGFTLNPPESAEGLDVTAQQTRGTTLDVTTNQRVAEFDAVENVQRITFQTSDRIDEVTVSDVNPDTGTVEAPGTGVSITDISVPEDARDTAATVEFTVSQERLEAVDADAADLRVFRGVDDGYQPLDTTVADENGDTITVTAETPGFSVFTVSAVSAPEAVAEVTPETVQAGDEVELSAADSTTEYGEIVSYEWTVAGESLSGETATATLEEAGMVDVELTVTNDAGETDTATTTVTVEQSDAGDGGVDDGTDDGVDGDDADQTDDGIPGFGVVVALVALIAAALLARRRAE